MALISLEMSINSRDPELWEKLGGGRGWYQAQGHLLMPPLDIWEPTMNFSFHSHPQQKFAFSCPNFCSCVSKFAFSEGAHWGGENNYETPEKRRNQNCSSGQDLVKSCRFIPSDFKAVIREIWCLYVSGFLSFQLLHPPRDLGIPGAHGALPAQSHN